MENQNSITNKLDPGFAFEMTGLISLGYLVFIVLIGNIGFLIGLPVTGFTLPLSFILYSLFIAALFIIVQPKRHWLNFAAAFSAFQILFLVLALFSVTYFAHSYDTSWDGEGYHSNAVISFAKGWNPVYQKELPNKFPDASIFVKGYPKALWLIQSSIYLAAGDFDAAKVTNLAAIIIAFIFSYTFCRKLRLAVFLSGLIALAAVLHPPFLVQFLSFSEDLFSYEIAVVAVSAFGMMVAEKNINKNLIGFTLALLMLMGSKFSNLPMVATLSSLFLILFVMVKMDDENDRLNWGMVGSLAAISLVFACIPYITNIVNYKHPFYPSNYASVNKTFREDNVPLNLWYSNNAELLFYSIYSRSQTKPMGKGDPKNTAELKLPFTFSKDEIIEQATIYNNRVGAAGPLFSGIFTLCILLWIMMGLQRRNAGDNANLHFAVFSGLVGICIILALVNPVPNLLRYNVQIVIIPPIVLVYALLRYRSSKLIQAAAYAMLILMIANAAVFTGAVMWRNAQEQSAIDHQLSDLANPAYRNRVWTNNFYSNYLRLDEAHVPYAIDKNLSCKNMKFLIYSSYTTRICQEKK